MSTDGRRSQAPYWNGFHSAKGEKRKKVGDTAMQVKAAVAEAAEAAEVQEEVVEVVSFRYKPKKKKRKANK